MTAKELKNIAGKTCMNIQHGAEIMAACTTIIDYLIEREGQPEPLPAAYDNPDPGPGYRLIDKERDEPQEGDEMWMPGLLRWEKRWYPTVGFSPVCHYRRRVEVATRPAIPEGRRRAKLCLCAASRAVGNGGPVMSDILPCPFCGKTTKDRDPDAYLPAVEFVTYEDKEQPLLHYIKCNWCGGTGPLSEDRMEAITMWNKPARAEEVRP